jgi:hypothetical protein
MSRSCGLRRRGKREEGDGKRIARRDQSVEEGQERRCPGGAGTTGGCVHAENRPRFVRVGMSQESQVISHRSSVMGHESRVMSHESSVTSHRSRVIGHESDRGTMRSGSERRRGPDPHVEPATDERSSILHPPPSILHSPSSIPHPGSVDDLQWGRSCDRLPDRHRPDCVPRARFCVSEVNESVSHRRGP